MRIHQTLYCDDPCLSDWTCRNAIQDSARLLILIYSSMKDRSSIERLVSTLGSAFPQATLLGCTSFGEILDGEILEESTVLNFLEFDHTELRSVLLPRPSGRTTEELGRLAARRLTGKDTKAFITFTTLLPGIEDFLSGLEAEAPSVLLAGGISSSNSGQHYLFTRDGIITEGAAGVSLSGRELHVHNAYGLNWQPIGRNFTVTRAEGERVYSIDNMKVTDLYARYLGNQIASQIIDKSTQFPFLLKRNGIEIGRDIHRIHEDGSVTLSGSLYTGETVRLGFGDPELIIESSVKLMESLREIPAEAVLIYSCEARRRFLFNSIHQELAPLREVAPASGFFTRGEFYHHNGRHMVINHSMTLLFLSERPDAVNPELPALQPRTDLWGGLDALKAMTHLAQVSTDELIQLNSSMELTQQRYRSLFQYNPDIVYSIDNQGTFLTRNKAFYEQLGFRKGDAPESIMDIIQPNDRWILQDAIQQASLGQARTFEIHMNSRSQTCIPFTVTKFPIVVNREIVGVYGIAKNIAERKEAERRITHMAYHDVLTELPNRTLFYRKLAEYMESGETEKLKLAVLFLDLDNFKDINDAFGHFTGDRILQKVAGQLTKLLQGRGVAARFGGDEFAIALQIGNPTDAGGFAKQVLRYLERPQTLNGDELIISSSIGISLYPQDGKDPETLLKNADLAMYRAKQSGKNRFQFFNRDLSDHTREKRKLISDLRKAIQKQELQVYYQPLMDLKTNRIIGSEALVRWFHKDRGAVPPSLFIPLAEENGLIDALGSQVLRTACLRHKMWQDQYGHPPTVSVNVSYRQFQQTEFVGLIRQTLKETGMKPEWLNLEITESTALINLEHTKLILGQLQRLGLTISMDDFGTGYSSLSCVKDLFMDKLKIDRSFVTNISTDDRDAAIIKTIIALSRNLNMKVLAEGVETKEQLDKLAEYGCDEAQGYWFSPPLPAEEFERRFLQGGE